eukprot:CAMPEP_0114512660 /NCGR_PEP_ID=MMETSP0109-20121206/15106_1 /TAXON_ID=29199 /ORGANISM="Chlorarachnion reptans, Strain CCCM449" /LENGTH=99 /DNA_ID=CAMNT_0001692383 /DNA_START=321 /DNA_END=620 /DNA_ORIENTATION=-
MNTWSKSGRSIPRRISLVATSKTGCFLAANLSSRALKSSMPFPTSSKRFIALIANLVLSTSTIFTGELLLSMTSKDKRLLLSLKITWKASIMSMPSQGA